MGSSRTIFISAVLVLAVFGLGTFLFVSFKKSVPVEPVVVQKEVSPKHEVIGKSVEGRNIDAYTYGTGEKHILFIGGMHGGYEWNSVLLAYNFLDYLEKNKTSLPKNVSVTVIPSLNPDGVYEVVNKEGRFVASDVSKETKILEGARFNAHNVDLNRNFDCKWKPESMWKSRKVSAGTSVFSEPEAKALRDFVLKSKPDAVVSWHSKADAVYASECHEGILPETNNIMDVYSKASGYKSVASFDAYAVTGDAESWLASIGIPAITVELSTHEDIEWEKNLAGAKALLEYYRSM